MTDGYYVNIDKCDEKGNTLGSHYNGAIKNSEEAINIVVNSLDQCGSNLVCYPPFMLSALGDMRLDDYICACYDQIRAGGEEQTIEFTIKVKITMGSWHKEE